MTIAAIFVSVTEVGEGVLSNQSHAGLQLHLILPSALALVTYVSTLLLYNLSETHNQPQYLIVQLVYWLGKCNTSLTQLINI